MKFLKLPFQPALFLALMAALSCSMLKAQSSELGIRIDQLSLASSESANLTGISESNTPNVATDLDIGLFFQLNKAKHYLRFGAGITSFNRYSETFQSYNPDIIVKYEDYEFGANASFEIGKSWTFLNIFRVHLGFETRLGKVGDRTLKRQNSIWDNNGNVTGLEVEETVFGGNLSLSGKAVLRADARIGKRFLLGAGLKYGSTLLYQAKEMEISQTLYDAQGNIDSSSSKRIDSDRIQYSPLRLASPFINISYRFGNLN